LKATAKYPEAVVVMPGINASSPYTEYFMVQNRYRMLNDTNYPGNGLLIWHVDATPNWSGNNFKYNNSYTDRKLLRLMEADGLEEIESNGSADVGDYYNSGETFDAYSTPDSKNYGNNNTMVSVSDISSDGISMTADIEILPEPAFTIMLLTIFCIFKKIK